MHRKVKIRVIEVESPSDPKTGYLSNGHGEAVAAGMALDVIYSRQTGLLDVAAAERALSLLEALGFELFAKEMLQPGADGRPALFGGLEEFREHLGGELSLTMLRDIGRAVQIHEVSLPGMLEAIHALRRRQERMAAKVPLAKRK